MKRLWKSLNCAVHRSGRGRACAVAEAAGAAFNFVLTLGLALTPRPRTRGLQRREVRASRAGPSLTRRKRAEGSGPLPRRLCGIHRIDERVDVLGKLVVAERGLADRPCTMPAFSARNSTEPALAADCVFDVHRHRAELRVWHQPRGPENLAEAADDGIIPAWRSAVEVGRRPESCDKSSAPTISAPASRLHRPCPLGEHRDAQPRRCRAAVDHAAHLWSDCLGSMPRLMAFRPSHRICVGVFLDKLHRVVERVGFLAIDVCAICGIFYRAWVTFTTWTPIERAEPMIMLHAASIRWR